MYNKTKVSHWSKGLKMVCVIPPPPFLHQHKINYIFVTLKHLAPQIPHIKKRNQFLNISKF